MEKQTFNGKEYTKYQNEEYFSRGTKRLHRVVWEYYNGEIPQGYHIHHKDHNKDNNDISNLEIIREDEHIKYHTSLQDIKEQRKRMEYARGFAKEWHSSQEGFIFHSALSKKIWENRKAEIKVCEYCGEEYETKHKGKSMYCNQNCKMKHYRRLGKLKRD